MNIFLIEDEPPLLRSLKNTILSFHEDYTIVGTACTGKQAAAFLDERHDDIDVMITDIQIPLMTGLEVAEYAAKKYPHILTIVLTGYSRFEYARAALQSGVFDYLLKPVDTEELKNVLKKAYAQKCRDYLYNRTTQPASGPAPASGSGGYVLTLFCTGLLPVGTAEFHTSGCQNLYADIKSALTESLSEKDFWIIPGRTPGEDYILFFFSDGSFSELYGRLSDYFKPLMHIAPSATAIVYPEFVQLSSIHTASARLREYAGLHISLEDPQFLCMEEDSEAVLAGDDSTLLHYHQALADLLAAKSLVLFHKELQIYITKLKELLPPQQYMFDLLCRLFQQCAQSLPPQIGSVIDVYATVCDVLNCSRTYHELYENLNSIFESYFEMLLKDEKTPAHKSDVILQIDSYIQENYRRDINTTTLAEHFNFTPAYLSRLFREYRSVTPSAYITQIRIEKAEELLKNRSDYKIKDVASYVGYDDPLYFSKVFKKVTGMTPKEYAGGQ